MRSRIARAIKIDKNIYFLEELHLFVWFAGLAIPQLVTATSQANYLQLISLSIPAATSPDAASSSNKPNPYGSSSVIYGTPLEPSPIAPMI